MSSSRSVLQKPIKRRFKRRGGITKQERAIVAGVLVSSPKEMDKSQVSALARVLDRKPETVKVIIEEAREKLTGRAGRYVDIHMQATEQALADGSPKALEQALKGSQWAITNISGDGARIVDKPNVESGGTKVMIGLKIGGLVEPSEDHDA